MNSKFIILYFICCSIFFIDCKKEEVLSSDTYITSFKIVDPGARNGVIDQIGKKVSFTPFEFQTDVSKAVVDIVTSSGATVSPASGSIVDFSKGPVEFTVTNGTLTRVYKASLNVDIAPAIAFIGFDQKSSDIKEQDTKAAFDFLSKKFRDSLVYLSFNNLNSQTLKFIKVIYYYENPDTVKVSKLNTAIPDLAKRNDVLDQVTKWNNNGGRIFLAGHAVNYLNDLKKLPSTSGNYESNPFRPSIYNSGEGEWSQDVNGVYKVKDHPIFQKLSSDKIKNFVNTTFYNELIFPLVDYGYQENHGAVWAMKTLKEDAKYANFSTPDLVSAFEKEMNCTILASTADDVDITTASIIEIYPKNGQGRMVCVGSSAYDWDQSPIPSATAKPEWYKGTNTNTYSANVKQLTLNTIYYLLNN